MPEGTLGIPWSLEARLEFIDFRLCWEGSVNRSDVMDYFGVSAPQVTLDLRRYKSLFPKNVRYDGKGKRYAASEEFESAFTSSGVEQYLNQLLHIEDGAGTFKTWIASIPSHDAVAFRRRFVDKKSLRRIVAAIRNEKAIQIFYHSMDEKEATWRWITPHALFHDGAWNIRAFCHEKRVFQGIGLARVVEASRENLPGAAPAADEAWHRFTCVELGANPGLSLETRKAVSLEFGLTEEKLEISVRDALLAGFLKSLETLQGTKRFNTQPLVVMNKSALRGAMKRISNADRLE
jgi:hypothetical protein